LLAAALTNRRRQMLPVDERGKINFTPSAERDESRRSAVWPRTPDPGSKLIYRYSGRDFRLTDAPAQW